MSGTWMVEGRDSDITEQHRLMRGQFYTPSALCDFMLALTLSPGVAGERLLDPGCGPGIFLCRAFERFQQLEGLIPAGGLSLPQERLLKTFMPQMAGIEIDPDSAELARDVLRGVAGAESLAEVVTGDFLAMDPDANPFDVIIGNPPYVRQEHLAQSSHQDKSAAISRLLAQYAEYLARHPEQRVLFSGTLDLYILFFLQAATLLKPGGRLTFVTSNSWLNVSYGRAFRRFLDDHFHIRGMVESACERWFPDAAINGLVLVLERKENESSSVGEPVRMIRFHQPVADWLPDSELPDYWRRLDGQAATLLAGEEQPCVSVRVLRQEQLQRRGALSNWGLVLRSPPEITAWLAQPEAHLPLERLGRVRYPLKTGINRFFYLGREQAEIWGIEPEFLRPVVKSIRKIRHYRIDDSDCEVFLFSCLLEKPELEARGKTGALSYIGWGETQMAPPRQKRAHPVPWPEVPSVRGNRPWYAIHPLPSAHLLCSRFLDRRFMFPVCNGDFIEDQTFYGLTLQDSQRHPPLLIAALLNSTLSFAMLEFNARTSLGEGVLQYARCDMAAFPVVDPALYEPKEREAIAEAFAVMVRQPVLTVAEELDLPERMALDRLILAPLCRLLGLGDAEIFREALGVALLSRMAERRQMARSQIRRAR
jgi:methylase of polypeptide subunit release factors